MRFSRILPVANLVACLLFVWLRAPGPAWYLDEVDQARLRGSDFGDSGVWGTLACRALNNWGPTHGGEAIGVAALEVVNLPSLVVTSFVSLFSERSFDRNISTCERSWWLAAVFVAFASIQWWFVGRVIDKRRHARRLDLQANGATLGLASSERIWLAYAVAPAGALPVTIAYVRAFEIVTGETVRGTSFLTVAAVISYFIGLFLLPLWWVFRKIGWQGWRYYVPTGAIAGLVTAISIMGGTAGEWHLYLLGSVLGMACAIVFSLVLAHGRVSAR